MILLDYLLEITIMVDQDMKTLPSFLLLDTAELLREEFLMI